VKNKNIILSSKVTRISEIDKRYMELEMVVSNTDPNLNGVVTTAEFLRANADSLVDMPLVVDKAMLEAGFTNSLTHKFDGSNLNTDIIGVFKEVYLESSVDDPDSITMKAKAKVYKRFPETIEAIKQLFDEDDLKFSWELLATDVDEIDGIAYINSGEFEGHCIVSNPAYGEDAVATKLVAEAHSRDVDVIKSEQSQEQEQEGGKSIDMKKTLQEFLAEVLTEKSIGDVRQEIQSQIRASISEEDTYVYIYDMYVSQVVYEVYSYDDGESNLYRVNYSVTDETISVDMTSSQEVVRVWMDKSDLEAQDNPMLSQGKDRKVSELTDEKVGLETEKSELEIKVSELQEKLNVLSEVKVPVVEPIVEPELDGDGNPIVSEKDTDPIEPDEKDVELADKVIALSESVELLKSEIEILKPFKDQIEAEEAEKVIAENEATKTRLSELVKKFTKEDEIPEEVQTFISEMDEKSIKLWIADKVILVTSEVDGEDDDEPIIVGTSDDNPLVEESDEEIEMY